MKMHPYAVLALALLPAFCSLYSAQSTAAASILIWPIDPVIEAADQASALWLENKDSKPVYMQIRVLGWQQQNGEDNYHSQSEIIASPPVATIDPGKRQLIRLVKTLPVPAGQERAYRILVDEIPRADENKTTQNIDMGLKFQMRYSVPLFVTGEGVWTRQNYEHPRDMATASLPQLSFRTVNQQGQRGVTITNQGKVHARLSKVSWVNGTQHTTLNDGLLGYVLPGAQMTFPAPQGGGTQLQATVNDQPKPMVINAR